VGGANSPDRIGCRAEFVRRDVRDRRRLSSRICRLAGRAA